MSVVITLNLDTITPRSAKALSLALASMSDPMDVTVTGKSQVSITELPVPEGGAKEQVDPSLPPSPMASGEPLTGTSNSPESGSSVGSVPSETKTRKPRAKKEDTTTASATATNETASPETTVETARATEEAGSPAQSPSTGATEPPTIEALRAGLQAKKDKSGMQAAIDLLDEFGCARITEVAALSPDKQAQFLSQCNA